MSHMLRVALLFLLLSTSFATAQSLHRHVIPQSMLPEERRDPTKEKKIDILLNSKQVDLEEKDEDGYTPLYVATMYNNTRFMKKLIDAGASINSKNNQKKRRYTMLQHTRRLKLSDCWYLKVPTWRQRTRMVTLPCIRLFL